jgi:serine/threonine-protein kinase RsbW
MLSVRRTDQLGPVVDALAGAMVATGYSKRDIYCMRLAMEEALINAVKHGHKGDVTKEVRVRYAVGPDAVHAEVEDQGPGFDPDQVPDPRDPENRELPGGRGLLLMRHYLTEVRFRGRGNRVCLLKKRTRN